MTQLTALPLSEKPQAAQLAGIALSPDGSKLAIALHGSGSPQAQRDPKIEVITLATGAARQWVWPGTGWVGNFKPIGEPLSWTADGRMLAFQKWTGGNVQVRLLDTTAPGSSLLSARLVVRFFNRDGVFTISPGNSIITPDGTKVVVPLARNTLRPETMELRITRILVEHRKSRAHPGSVAIQGTRAGVVAGRPLDQFLGQHADRRISPPARIHPGT